MVYSQSSQQLMSAPKITDKQVKHLCVNDTDVRQAHNEEGQLRYVKFLKISRIDQLGISQCLDFNRAVLGDLEQYLYPQHFLRVEQQIRNKTVIGLVTEPYELTLEKHIKSKKYNQKESLAAFDQILKAVYSLHLAGFSTRSLRTEHFVFTKKSLKLASLIYSNEYSQAQGAISEYLWSPKHQAPECFGREQFKDEQFQPILVWNLGCILLEVLLSNHKLSTLDAMKKFKDQPFSFKALGMKQHTWNHFSEELQQTLTYMLHYNPNKRMTLEKVFSRSFLSAEVANHFIKTRPNPISKIGFGKSSVRTNKLSSFNSDTLNLVGKQFEERQKEKEQTLRASKICDDVFDDEDFLGGLQEVSKRIPRNALKGVKIPQENKKMEDLVRPVSIKELSQNERMGLDKCLQTYKSYLDQSELLNLAIDIIDEINFEGRTAQELKQLKLLIKYAISLVSLVNLNSLAEGFNRNRNILNLPSDDYIFFTETDQCQSLQEVVNFRRNQRAVHLQHSRQEIKMLKDKPLLAHNPFLSDLLNANYKDTNFQKIKAAYRYIVKHAYDQISQEYNQKKKTPQAGKLSRVAMYVTFCLTTDKLYIKEDIPDNFKFFFKWAHKPPSSSVPLSEFKRYLNSAPKEDLIQNSRFILKKYYNL